MISKVLKAYYAGLKTAMEKKPSNVPPKLSKEEKKAWRNGYKDGR